MGQFQYFHNQNITLMGRHCTFKGDLKLQGIIRIASHIEGNITIDPFGSLTLEREGSITGDIHCFDIEIFGQFRGSLYSEGKVIIQPMAQVLGEIKARQLIIYPGAIVNMEGNTLERTNDQRAEATQKALSGVDKRKEAQNTYPNAEL